MIEASSFAVRQSDIILKRVIESADKLTKEIQGGKVSLLARGLAFPRTFSTGNENDLKQEEIYRAQCELFKIRPYSNLPLRYDSRRKIFIALNNGSAHFIPDEISREGALDTGRSFADLRRPHKINFYFPVSGSQQPNPAKEAFDCFKEEYFNNYMMNGYKFEILNIVFAYDPLKKARMPIPHIELIYDRNKEREMLRLNIGPVEEEAYPKGLLTWFDKLR